MNEQHIQMVHSIVSAHGIESLERDVLGFVGRFFSGELSLDDYLDEFGVFVEEHDIPDDHLLDIGEALYVQVLMPNISALKQVEEENKKTFLEVVSELSVGIEFESPRMERRFAHLCEVYLNGEYGRLRVSRAFAKGVKAGGMALPEEQVVKITAGLDRYKGRVRFDSESSEVHGKEGEVIQMQSDEKVVIPKKVPVKKTPEKPVVVVKSQKVSAPKSVVKSSPKKVAVSMKKDFPEEVVLPSVKVVEKEKDIQQRVDVARQAQKVIDESGLTYDDKNMQQRLHDIVLARLKNVRGVYETRDMVMKSVEKGGLGIDIDESQKFLRVLEEANDSLERSLRQQVKKEKAAYVAGRRKQLFAKPKSRQTVPSDVKSVDIVSVVQKTPREKRAAVVAEHLKQVKPKIRDVQAPPRLMNPISELASYTLEDFHRLHSDPEEAVHKIEAKINMLRDESFGQMKKGVAAWQKSEVMCVYREQLQQSVEGGIPLSEVIEKREQAGLLHITPAEISALTMFNARLRS